MDNETRELWDSVDNCIWKMVQAKKVIEAEIPDVHVLEKNLAIQHIEEAMNLIRSIPRKKDA